MFPLTLWSLVACWSQSFTIKELLYFLDSNCYGLPACFHKLSIADCSPAIKAQFHLLVFLKVELFFTRLKFLRLTGLWFSIASLRCIVFTIAWTIIVEGYVRWSSINLKTIWRASAFCIISEAILILLHFSISIYGKMNVKSMANVWESSIRWLIRLLLQNFSQLLSSFTVLCNKLW